MDRNDMKRYAYISALAVIGCFIVLNVKNIAHLIGLLFSSITPLILGCCLAYVFNIIMNFLEKHYFPGKNSGAAEKTRRPVCLAMSFVIVIAMAVLIMYIIIPEIIRAGKIIYAEIPPLFIKARDYCLDKLGKYPDVREQLEGVEIDKAAAVQTLTQGAFGIFGSVLSIIGTITSVITHIIIAIVFAIYLLARKDKLYTDIKRVQKAHFSERFNQRVNYFFAAAHDVFTNFFIGQLIEAIIIGTLTFIGALILRLPYAGMTGTIIGVTALVPIVGALVGAALSALIICTVSPMKALVFLIFLIILQQLEDNIIYPKIMGNSIGLPGIWVLASITVGGGLFGIVGMLLGVPLTATVYKLYFEHLSRIESAADNGGDDSENEE